MSKDKILYRALGDVRVSREDGDTLFADVAATLNDSDLVSAQVEASYSTRGEIGVNLTEGYRSDPKCVPSMARAGIDVVSVASNHSADYGYVAFMDTIKYLNESGIKVIGGGANIYEARTPAIFDIKGTKIAFLGYNAILQPGYDATENRPGMARLRVRTMYEQVDWQPGTPAKIWSIPNPDDVDAILEDVKKAKAVADLVVVYLHWGVHFIVGYLAAYQTEVGHKVIDAGADMIIGHHTHALNMIEMYKDKPIFYSMGNFAFDAEVALDKDKDPYVLACREIYKEGNSPRFNEIRYPLLKKSSIIANITIADKKVERLSFLPVILKATQEPTIVSPDSKEGKEVVRLMTELSEPYNTKLTVEGEEVVITAINNTKLPVEGDKVLVTATR